MNIRIGYFSLQKEKKGSQHSLVLIFDIMMSGVGVRTIHNASLHCIVTTNIIQR